MEQKKVEVWLFNCPWHGWEKEIFCFRAFDRDLVDLWDKFEVTNTRIETNKAQKMDFQEKFVEYMNR